MLHLSVNGFLYRSFSKNLVFISRIEHMKCTKTYYSHYFFDHELINKPSKYIKNNFNVSLHKTNK